jgi:site-specific DNA-methyltransferase (adenine-specific)
MIELMLGDCLKLMNRIEDRSVDMVLCDLPYGTTACKWDSVIPFAPLWAHYKRVIKPEGAIVLFAAQPFTSALVMSNPKDFKYQWVWDKVFAANFSLARTQPLRNTEDIMVFGNGKTNYFPQKTQREKPIKLGKNVRKSGSSNLAHTKSEFDGKVYHDKNPQTLLTYSNRAEGMVRHHPTQKPVELLEYLIQTYSQPGWTVLDNTMGSGSTGVACVNTRRDFIGIEMEPAYFEIAKTRIGNAEDEALV